MHVERQPSARPALASFAEFLRQAFAFELDVSPDEFRVGRQLIALDGTRSEQIFVADTLENGAGYARMASDPVNFKNWVRSHFNRQSERWSAPAHSASCDRSCPDCLRSYGNRFTHSMLDWRLALDLAQVALGEELDTTPWLGGAGDHAMQSFARLCASFGIQVEVENHGGLSCVTHGGRGLILSHPLWHVVEGALQPQQLRALTSFRAAHGAEGSAEFVDARDFAIRSAAYILKIQSLTP